LTRYPKAKQSLNRKFEKTLIPALRPAGLGVRILTPRRNHSNGFLRRQVRAGLRHERQGNKVAYWNEGRGATMDAGEHRNDISQQLNEMLIAIERQEVLLRRMRVDLEKLSFDLTAISHLGQKAEKPKIIAASSAIS
jgi:hypothetical protein